MRKCIRIAADYDVYFSTGKIYNYQIFDANGIKKHRIIGNNGSHYIYGEQRFNYYFIDVKELRSKKLKRILK